MSGHNNEEDASRQSSWEGRRNGRSAAALERLRTAADAQGFVCHAEQWNGVGARYPFECASGHRFERVASSVLYRVRGCQQCRRGAVQDRFEKIVADRGGECLDGRYLGHRVRHQMRCCQGHEWTPEGCSLLQGVWCPHCAGVGNRQRPEGAIRKYGLAQLHARAAEQGGRCLALVYRTGWDYYPFECAAGHSWEAMAYKIFKGSWCRLCADARLAAERTDADGLTRIQAAASAHGGRCLSETYRGVNRPHWFQCASGHTWKALGRSILHGAWCRRCQNNRATLGIEAMHALAQERGGRCLSDTYVNNKTKLTWECHRGHVWSAIPGNVKGRGQWCPQCAILNTIRAKNQWKRKRYEAVHGELEHKQG